VRIAAEIPLLVAATRVCALMLTLTTAGGGCVHDYEMRFSGA
jgi:hypothetical protein